MTFEAHRRGSLASSSGYDVVSDDGVVGVIETPIFSGSADEPDYLIVRVGSAASFHRVTIPVGLVRATDRKTRSVVVAASSRTIAALPTNLPIGRRS
jgi:hypothetical protein